MSAFTSLSFLLVMLLLTYVSGFHVSRGVTQDRRSTDNNNFYRLTKTSLHLGSEKVSLPKRLLTSREALNLRSGGTSRSRFIFGEAGTEREEVVEPSGGEALPQLPALPTDAVGFSGLSEVLNGRLAILGLVVGLITELCTGKSIVEQVGLVDWTVLPGLVAVVGLISAINFEYKKRRTQ